MRTYLASPSTCGDKALAPIRVAIIMDGNGRWASRRGLPRPLGHRAGAAAVRRVTEAALADGTIRTLTLYAFSSDNRGRPPREVSALMALLEEYLAAETGRCARAGVRVNVIGRRDRLPPSLRTAISLAERETAACEAMDLRLAVDYSSRDAIVAAAAEAPAGREAFARRLGEVISAPGPASDVDLLIRTGGEHRLSDFLLWECAYAELYFVDCLWPDFDAPHLQEALQWFAGRQRRYGRLPASPSASPAAGAR